MEKVCCTCVGKVVERRDGKEEVQLVEVMDEDEEEEEEEEKEESDMGEFMVMDLALIPSQ